MIHLKKSIANFDFSWFLVYWGRREVFYGIKNTPNLILLQKLKHEGLSFFSDHFWMRWGRGEEVFLHNQFLLNPFWQGNNTELSSLPSEWLVFRLQGKNHVQNDKNIFLIDLESFKVVKNAKKSNVSMVLNFLVGNTKLYDICSTTHPFIQTLEDLKKSSKPWVKYGSSTIAASTACNLDLKQII